MLTIAQTTTKASLSTTTRAQRQQKKTLRSKIVSKSTEEEAEEEGQKSDEEETKGGEKMPDRGFLSVFAPDGEKSADDYNKWKAELMEKKRKAQEEAAKKPKKFLGLF
jgi:hypothetical protein